MARERTMKIFLLCGLLAVPAFAINVTSVAAIFSIAANSGQIVKEGKGLSTHPIKTLKDHWKKLKEAAKEKH